MGLIEIRNRVFNHSLRLHPLGLSPTALRSFCHADVTESLQMIKNEGEPTIGLYMKKSTKYMRNFSE